MKITDVQFKKFCIELAEPFKVAFTEVTHSVSILLKIETDEGYTGYGEAAPFAPVTGENAEGCLAVLEVFRQGLIGLNPLDIEKIHVMMDNLVHGNGSAKCAVDIALHDLKGKVMNQPLYRVLGGYQDTVQNDITIGINAPEKMAALAEDYVKNKGYRILKIKTGIDPEEDLRALSLIRQAIGPDIRLRVDANQGYNINSALYALEGMKKYGVEAVEQCLPDWDLEGASYLRKKVNGIQLMLDESIHTTKDAARACRLEAADIFNIKLMKCGGLYRGAQISTLAENFGITCMVGCMMETKIAITAGLSLVASRKNITEADCDSFLYYKDADTGMPGGFERNGDMFRLSDKPGLGLEIEF
ncbi:MAG: dipeptide epimerase [Lachnospiraceae bacterium]|nr:dipeptide epimerase [Lachnospiraceae bacterium]